MDTEFTKPVNPAVSQQTSKSIGSPNPSSTEQSTKRLWDDIRKKFNEDLSRIQESNKEGKAPSAIKASKTPPSKKPE
ncbi:MAG: hypothetical protein H0X51_04605 [Parachlamydiaceae bacterium]|nr:hypothetical protein [Parachlamydiaceae bacterium]